MRYLILLATLLISTISFSQKPEYNVSFYGFGDNREFSNSKMAPSQTILGERTSFEIGTTLEENHQFRVGLNHLFEFGSDIDFNQPKLTAYYHFSDKKKEFYFGAFPRMDVMDFPLAILTDTLHYYRPNIEGFLGKYTWEQGYQGGFVDWTGRQSEEVREAFLAGTFGKINMNQFFFENYLVIYHLANDASADPDVHIQDNAAFAFYLGTDLKKLIPLQKAYIKVGTLGSFFRERSVTDGYIKAWSFVGELYGESKNFALKTSWHAGDGHRITFGDRFYDADSYVRTDIFWKFIKAGNIQGKFNWSFHLVDGEHLDSSQQLSLIYRFGN